ncbi:MAG: alpha/beta fold hydrolase [Colwellia sp.]
MNTTTKEKAPILNYQQWGEGEDVILIHGLLGSLDNLNMIAKELSSQYRVTSVDVRNHGSSFHEAQMSYSLLAQDVFNVLKALSIKECSLLGHSMGGKIAMEMAIQSTQENFPINIKKLIVADIAPVTYLPRHNEILEGLQSINLTEIKNRKEADLALSNYVKEVGVRQFLLRNLQPNNDGSFKFKCNINNIEKFYPHILKGISLEDERDLSEKPTSLSPYLKEVLFIKGGKSNYILPEHKTAISALFPNSKAKIIQGAGHWLHAEKPVAFNKIVKDFLNN